MTENLDMPASPAQVVARGGERSCDYPRDFLDNRFVSVAVSPRARGLAIDVNLNPDTRCNFNCVYCRVKPGPEQREQKLDTLVLGAELEKTLRLVSSGEIRQWPRYAKLSPELLRLRHVAISGDGEPTLCPQFTSAVETIVHVRAQRPERFFKIVLLTNGSLLDAPAVQEALQYFTHKDEIWVKLDAGSQGGIDRINRSAVPLEKIAQNIVMLGQRRSIAIQSLFPLVDGHGPPTEEIDQYIQRLNELKNGGACISCVQIYSATQTRGAPWCGHLPLQNLRAISARVRAETGLSSEVF